MDKCIKDEEWTYKQLKMYDYSEACIEEKKDCTDPSVKTFNLNYQRVLKEADIPRTIWSKDPDLNNDGVITLEEFVQWQSKKESFVFIVAVFVVPVLIMVLLFTIFYAKQKMSGQWPSYEGGHEEPLLA